MKSNWKVILIASVLLVNIVLGFMLIDSNVTGGKVTQATTLKVVVVDENNQKVEGATVAVLQTNLKFETNNLGQTKSIEVPTVPNWYDSKIKSWFCVNVAITHPNYVDTLVVGCVLTEGKLRILQVKVFEVDDSGLPYVSYVESPPDSYLKDIFK